MKTDRRTFLLAGAGALPMRAAPGEQIRLGVIGAGGRGILVMESFQKDPAVRVAAVCDVYEPNLEQALTVAAKTPGNRPRACRNYQQVLDDPDIDAVLIATPEHWHARMVLDALAADKNVYVEKPLCQTPEQGVELVEAERKSKRIVQVGMQRRSYDLYLAGREVVAAGTLGSVRMVRSWWLNTNLGRSPDARISGSLDWEQWQGPAKTRVPLDPYRFRHWREFSDYAGGIVADQGAHVFDGIHLLMNAGYPLAVNASAGRIHVPKVDTPESVVVTAEYPADFIAVFTINYAAMRYRRRNDQMNHLDGDKARMDIGREELNVYLQGAEEKSALHKASVTGFDRSTDTHVANFLACVRTGAAPAAPMRLGFQAVLVPMLANLSLKLGRRVKWNDTTRKVEI
jgi:predicted dehydrogenase